MKTRSTGRFNLLLLLAIIISPVFAFSQQSYDVNYQTINFGGAGVTITYKVGTTGKSAGNVTLYQNVVTIGGQSIDAIIRTTSLTAGTVMDYFDRTGTGTGYTNNQDSYFSPQFTFGNGGGSAVFNFEFILGGSYNNTTNTGTPVILENVRLNTYDIDGNGNAGSNQYNEFGGFLSSELSTGTSIAATYNSATGLTKFRSSISSNVTNAADPTTRIRVTYGELSKLTMQIGAEGSGQAYYFLDFGVGASFTSTTTVTAPTLDLNTTTAGNHNAATFCSTAVPFTAGGTNINSVSTTPSGGTTINQVKITFPSTDILNGANEQLLINGATSGGTIALNFANGASISNVVLSSKTYTVTATVVNGESSLVFVKSGSSTMTLAEGESLLDAFRYMNTATTPSIGDRDFEVRLKDGAYESQAYNFVVTVGTNPTITDQPSNQTVIAGTNTVITSASNNATSYQWQVNPQSGTFSNISNSTLYNGATTNTLTIKSTPASLNNYQYRTLVTNGACTVTSLSSTVSMSASLPVEWLGFSAKEQNRVVTLEWSTSAEVNSKEFFVQHSVDGIKYKDVGVVHAAGNSAVKVDYKFDHRNPSVGNNYYRIRQVDRDGKSINSKVVSVSIKTDAKIFTVLTNPVSAGTLNVQVHIPATLALYSSAGAVVFRTPVTVGKHSFPVSGYGKGTFTLVAGRDVQMILVK